MLCNIYVWCLMRYLVNVIYWICKLKAMRVKYVVQYKEVILPLCSPRWKSSHARNLITCMPEKWTLLYTTVIFGNMLWRAFYSYKIQIETTKMTDYPTRIQSFYCLLTESLSGTNAIHKFCWIYWVVTWNCQNCFVDFVSCDMYLSKLIYGFLKVASWICQSCSMYFSPFVKQNQAEVWPRFQSLQKLLL